MSVAYIYIRTHPSYDVYNACKLGKASNITDKDKEYVSRELQRGYFESVFEVPIQKLDIIGRLLHSEFEELNIRYDAGTQFYNKEIITLIEPYLSSLRIDYKKLSVQEINDLTK
jgi:hypothetical protein